ncbi:hypothetical protein EVG20_g4724 [Dentipellis fragilis]|uniref:Uncharacterized protein n=1 Tax=Dentipellis fragilis TaxID=205917 RepID=A0A4Y9YUW3_9AGAM|nr:hypothetical protein EVG20_g4724 [Dentipellis fragilis]
MSRYWDIYEKELRRLGHGLPVWQAEPFGPKDEVHVGDVGYMEYVSLHFSLRVAINVISRSSSKGRFRRVFNAFYGDTRSDTPRRMEEDEDIITIDASHSSASFRPATWESGLPNCYGVPANHVPWVMPAHEFGLHGYLYRGTHSGSHCTVTEASPRAGVDPTPSVPGLEVGASVSFTSERQRGAALILRTDAESREVPEDLFKGWSGPLWESWREFTSSCDAHYQHGDHLRLVYGHTKAAAWTAIAAEHNQRSGKLAFDIDLPAIGSGGLDFRREEIATTSPYINHGPRALRLQTEAGGNHPTSSATARLQLKDLKINQTVFIRRINGGGKSSLKRLRDIFALKAGRQEQGTTTASGPVQKASDKQSQSPLSRFKTEKRGSVDTSDGTDSDSLFSPTLAAGGDLSSTEFDMDPLDELLLHVLEAEEDAECAVVSDDDINALFNQFSVLRDDSPQPEDMTELIKELRPATASGYNGVASATTDRPSSYPDHRQSRAVPAHIRAIPAHPQYIPGTSAISYPSQVRTVHPVLHVSEDPLRSTIADARKSYWSKMLEKSFTLLSLSYSNAGIKTYRTKIENLQHQLSVMLRETEKFLDILSREDIYFIGEERKAILFLDNTALITILLCQNLLVVWRDKLETQSINAFSQIIGTYQSVYTKMIPEPSVDLYDLKDPKKTGLPKSHLMPPITDIMKTLEKQMNFNELEIGDLVRSRREARIPIERL